MNSNIYQRNKRVLDALVYYSLPLDAILVQAVDVLINSRTSVAFDISL
jgi:hypothetical protein